MNKIPEELSVFSMLESDSYTIPLYQRNYAWTEIEITQLLQDIWDKSTEKEGNYYIGTLVVVDKNGSFEIIDGQQRYTTLTLINAVIRNNSDYKNDLNVANSNINFDSRQEIEEFIDGLFKGDYEKKKRQSTDHLGVKNIQNALRHIESFFHSKNSQNWDQKSKNRMNEYQNYFYKNVKVIRIGVPPETDINHYFEIMNNRGEQLEKHEILKAKFIYNTPNELQDDFGLIWDACSQMDKPIQMCFEKDRRREMFGSDYTEIHRDFDLKQITKKDGLNNLLNILENPGIDSNQDQNVETGSKYKSIIDFSNFLLQVLRLQEGWEHVSLDDKKLLDEFLYPNRLPEPQTFIKSILYYRALFDKYIIKREEGSDEWKIRQQNQSDEVGYVNTFGDDEEFIMLQSMFHVSSPSNNYKNWLNKVLVYFKRAGNNFSSDEFKKELIEIATEEYRTAKDSGLNEGTNTPRYLFNYLDYLLWREYNEKIRNRESSSNLTSLLTKIEMNKQHFNKFRFILNNSVEHMHPQAKVDNLKILIGDDFSVKKNILNHFGNLCLISQGSNSKYSDYNFSAKREQFDKSKATESLKQVIMFSYPVTEWNTEQIKEHGEEMMRLIDQQI